VFWTSYLRSGPGIDGLDPEEAVRRLVVFRKQRMALESRLVKVRESEALFGTGPAQFAMLV